MDFVVPGSGGKLRLIEVKSTRTPLPAMARPLQALGRALGHRAEMWLVHRSSRAAPGTSALAEGVKAVELTSLLRAL